MHEDLIAVADMVEVMDPLTFVLGGRTFAARDEALDASTVGPESILSGLLYRHAYLRSPRDAKAVTDVSAERDFQIALSRANTGRGTWEPGWRAEADDGEARVVTSPHRIRFWVHPDRVRPGPTGFEKGQLCQVHVPKEHRHLLPAFYLIIGDTETNDTGSMDVATVRLYWHLTSPAAPHFVGAISHHLNDASIPFRAKVLSSPGTYHRADAGVLYLARDSLPSANEPLRRIYSELRDLLRADAPLFTLRLGRGLALAEDPGKGLSFGQHRCTLVARALWAAHEDGRADSRSRYEAVASAFRAEGLDPDAPHLGAGSAATYDLLGAPARGSPAPSSTPSSRSSASPSGGRGASTGGRTDGDLLQVAVRIGHALCSQAHWDAAGKRCTWVGRSNPVAPAPTGRVLPTAAVLGPFLYAGLSGVALFLAELFAHTGEATFRRTALAAVNCALQQIERRNGAPAARLGFYVGATGVACTASRVWRRTGVDAASDRLLRIASDAFFARQPQDSDDLISGRAGAILGLLCLSRQPGLSQCHEWAITLGNEICRSGIIQGDTPEATAAITKPLLTGLSHGAAGMGVALFALHAQTGREDFRRAARRALAYEDRLFDPVEGNWLDLRPPTALAGAPSTARYAVAWCHGAPGIALSRLQAMELDPARSDHHQAHARAALDTTRAHLRSKGRLDAVDATPCHGITGLIDALWTGHLVLRESAYGTAAVEAVEELARLAPVPKQWRSGTACGGPNPSLMLGIAGVGYHFLRIHDPHGVPTILLGPLADEDAVASST